MEQLSIIALYKSTFIYLLTFSSHNLRM